MINILKAFKTVWTYPTSASKKSSSVQFFGKSEVGKNEFFRSLEIFPSGKKYSFK